MTPRRWFLALAILSTVVLMVAQARLVSARGQAEDARSVLAASVDDVVRLRELRSRWKGVVLPERPSADQIGRVQQALVAAGLPITACGAVQSRGDQPVANSKAQVQTMVVNLNALTPAETGAFLAALRASEPAWRVSELQLASVPGPAGSLDTNRYAVTVALQVTFLEEPM